MTVTSTGRTSGWRAKAARGRTTGRGASRPTAPPICPYLIAEDGAWRSSRPSREHRCGAVEPAAVLALDKQRRLCLVAAHGSCATRIAAAELRSRDEVDDDDLKQGDTSSSRAGTVTRWSIVRTAPVVLEPASQSPARFGDRRRRTIVEGAIGALMALALGAVLLIARLPEAGGGAVPAVLSATGLPSNAAMAAVASSSPPLTPRPTVRPTIGPPLRGSVVAPASGWFVPVSASPLPRAHRVRAGDTLYAIAASYGTTVETLQTLNDLGESTTIRIGQELRLP